MSDQKDEKPKTNPEVEEPTPVAASSNGNKRRRESTPSSPPPAKKVKTSTDEEEEQPTSTSRLRKASDNKQQQKESDANKEVENGNHHNQGPKDEGDAIVEPRDDADEVVIISSDSSDEDDLDRYLDNNWLDLLENLVGDLPTNRERQSLEAASLHVNVASSESSADEAVNQDDGQAEQLDNDEFPHEEAENLVINEYDLQLREEQQYEARHEEPLNLVIGESVDRERQSLDTESLHVNVDLDENNSADDGQMAEQPDNDNTPYQDEEPVNLVIAAQQDEQPEELVDDNNEEGVLVIDEEHQQEDRADEEPESVVQNSHSPVYNEDTDSPEDEEPDSNRDAATDDPIDLNRTTHLNRLQRDTDLQNRVQLDTEMAVSFGDFQILRLIGEGAHGKVFLVRKRNGLDVGQVYAMKVISKMIPLRDWKSAERIKIERVILEAIQEVPFMVNLHYAFQSEHHLFLVTDFIQGGELYRRLQLEGPLPEAAVRLYVAELVLALEALHQANIVYRDLKLENILIDSEGHIVVADFGLATVLIAEKLNRTKSFCGTLSYMAPEVIVIGPDGYDTRVDWWSLGVFTLELLTSINPFALLSREEISQRIFHGNIELPLHLSEGARDFIRRLMETDINRRMGAEEIRAHEFLQGIDWSMLPQKQHNMPFRPTLEGIEDVSHFDTNFTSKPIELPLCEVALPSDLCMYNGFDYISPRLLEWRRDHDEEDVEFRNPEADIIPTLPDDTVLGRRLLNGASACGTCFLMDDNILVKIIHLSKFHVSEVDALMTFSHENIVHYYGTYRNSCEIWIMMEYLRGRDLFHAISSGQLNEELSRLLFRQMVSAVQHLHMHHFIHGDLKPENIVFANETDMTIKLVDFGLARYSRDFRQWEDYPRYTPLYAPPELITPHNNRRVAYTPAVDIYGLGVTLYCMIVGSGPYHYDLEVEHISQAEEQLLNRIQQEPFDQEAEGWLNASQALRDLVSWCLEKDPAARPSLVEILNSEWLREETEEDAGPVEVQEQVEDQVQDHEEDVQEEEDVEEEDSQEEEDAQEEEDVEEEDDEEEDALEEETVEEEDSEEEDVEEIED